MRQSAQPPEQPQRPQQQQPSPPDNEATSTSFSVNAESEADSLLLAAYLNDAGTLRLACSSSDTYS